MTTRQAEYSIQRQGRPAAERHAGPHHHAARCGVRGAQRRLLGLADHRNQMVLASTDDGGSTWTVVDGHLPATVAATAADAQMEFHQRPQVGYLWSGATAGGRQAPLWVTDNGGATWTAAPIGTAVYDVSAIGANVWALAARLHTGSHPVPGAVGGGRPDAGVSWEAQPVAVPASLPAADASSTQVPDRAAGPGQPRTGLRLLVHAHSRADARLHHRQRCHLVDRGGRTALRRAVRRRGRAGSVQHRGPVARCAAAPLPGVLRPGAVYRSSNGGRDWTEVAQTPTPAPAAASASGRRAGPSEAGFVAAPTAGQAGSGAVKRARPGTGAARVEGTAATAPVIGTLPLQGYVAPYSIGHKTLAVPLRHRRLVVPDRRGGLGHHRRRRHLVHSVGVLQLADFGSGGAGNITFVDANHGWVVELGVRALAHHRRRPVAAGLGS